jgi:hypothetical protein
MLSKRAWIYLLCTDVFSDRDLNPGLKAAHSQLYHCAHFFFFENLILNFEESSAWNPRGCWVHSGFRDLIFKLMTKREKPSNPPTFGVLFSNWAFSQSTQVASTETEPIQLGRPTCKGCVRRETSLFWVQGIFLNSADWSLLYFKYRHGIISF